MDEDKIITCRDCKEEFTFDVGEQEFFANQSPPFPDPVRCKECRAAKKAKYDANASQ